MNQQLTDAQRLAELSVWIDGSEPNAYRGAEALTWGRLAKVAEEAGEVIAAFIGATGQNPRKGFTHTYDDVARELLDVALTALTAYEHITDHARLSTGALSLHIEFVHGRAQLSEEGSNNESAIR